MAEPPAAARVLWTVSESEDGAGAGQRVLARLDQRASREQGAAGAAKLVELGVKSISVRRQKKGTQTVESFQFDAASCARRGGRFAPTRDELKAELHADPRAHPKANRTEVAKLMAPHKHELIYTPPYLPCVQPIERLWAYVKNHVAARYHSGRSMREVIAQAYQGLYGDGD